MVLSSTNPVRPAMNMLVCSKTRMMSSNMSTPVLIKSAFTPVQVEMDNEKKMEKPKMKRFLGELRSTNCALEMPTAVMRPKLIKKTPPMIGSGKVAKKAPGLRNTPRVVATGDTAENSLRVDA